MKYNFTVPFLPTSINKMYSYNYRTKQKYLVEEARHFKTAIKLACPPMSFSTKNPFLDIYAEYHSPKWICKNGNVRKADGANLDKMLHDSIVEKLGLDDCMVFSWSGLKVLSLEEFTNITVEEITEEELRRIAE